MKVNGEDVMKKTHVFCEVREVPGGRLDLSDDIRPDWQLEIGIDVMPGDEIEMDPYATTQKPAPSLGVSPQIVINHLQYDLEMKLYDLAEVTKRQKSALRADHAGRA
jgi:hypothetical protein